MTIIAAITSDRALGTGGDMLFHLSEDLKRFKALTMGHPLIMGRRTFESFPKGPLPGRRNMVITRSETYSHPGIETFKTIEDAVAACDGIEPMIVGGGQIYAQTMPMANRLLITEIDVQGLDADTYFPEIDPEEWTVTSTSEWHTDPRSGVKFRYVDYQRN